MTHSSDPIIILFNYGGGMRGLIPAHLMARIEKATGLRMAEMVDVFAGPSTASILNAALNIPHPHNPERPKYRARHMVKFYEREGIKIFPPDRFRAFRGLLHDFNNRTMKIGQLKRLMRQGHYDPAYLYHCLNELYGDFKLSDSLRNLVIPVYNIDGEQLDLATERDEDDDSPALTQNNINDQGGHAVWLRHVHLGGRERSTPEVNMRDAVMASAAAPTFFPCHHFDVNYADDRGRMFYSGIDGSIFDNPCISFHGALRPYIPAGREVIMIALGTGTTQRSYKKDDWNELGGLGVVDPANNLPLINILFHAPESALIESFADELGDNFYSFNKSLLDGNGMTPSMEIDDAGEENLKKMKHFSEALIEENQSRFDEICHILATRRDKKIHEEKTPIKHQGFLDKIKDQFFQKN